MTDTIISILPLLLAWLLDLVLGDPRWLAHPVVGFGRMIAFCERRLNHGRWRMAKGAGVAVGLILLVYGLTYAISIYIPERCAELSSSAQAGHLAMTLKLLVDTVCIFFCLAGTTLVREVREVFRALDRSLEDGRRQVARIVGRDTAELSAQEIRTAALETLAENLSDGVIAPLFWLAVGGVPAMMAYKMVNTLDSMLGYRTDRYRQFGCWAARIDDAANYIPARLTALLMIVGYKINRKSPKPQNPKTAKS